MLAFCLLLVACGGSGSNDGATAARGSVYPACYDATRMTSKSVADHRCTWPAFALKLQRRLARSEPLGENLILATHNSFNVQGLDGFSSEFDPNQLYTVKDQLRLSMRGLELDVHWIKSQAAGNQYRPLLCHGTSSHGGCMGDEPNMKVDLRAIRDWLYAHPDQFVLLDIQAEFNGKKQAYEAAGKALQDVLGGLIYKPGNDNCASMPLKMSRADMLASGAQVLVTGTCGPTGTTWRTVVHSTDVRVQRNNLVTDKFTAYPDCDSSHFTPGDYAHRWTRLWEDTTKVGAGTHNAGEINGQDLQRMIQCGINEPSLDKLTPRDPRFPDMVWSWARGEPAQGTNLNCAKHGANGHFVAADCRRSLPYACYDADSKNWTITKKGGPWSNGAKVCARETDGKAAFAVPFNGHNNQKLRETEKSGNYTDVWLNYSDRNHKDGDWIPDLLK